MSTNLTIGDEVVIDTAGRKTIHVIVARRFTSDARSGVAYRLLPAVDPEWIDARRVRRAKGFGSGVDRRFDPFAGEAA